MGAFSEMWRTRQKCNGTAQTVPGSKTERKGPWPFTSRGVCSSVLDTNPHGVGGGGGPGGGGGQSKSFLHFGGIFEFPISF